MTRNMEQLNLMFIDWNEQVKFFTCLICALYLFTVIIGDPKYNIKTDRECFENIIKHSSSASALALNLLDNLVPKEVQRISKIKGVLGKAPLDPGILAAIKGQLKRQYKWSDEETDKNWSGKAGIQQKIADKCRNLNKSFGKKKIVNILKTFYM